jgi:hypothetical protein
LKGLGMEIIGLFLWSFGMEIIGTFVWSFGIKIIGIFYGHLKWKLLVYLMVIWNKNY